MALAKDSQKMRRKGLYRSPSRRVSKPKKLGTHPSLSTRKVSPKRLFRTLSGKLR